MIFPDLNPIIPPFITASMEEEASLADSDFYERMNRIRLKFQTIRDVYYKMVEEQDKK